MLVAIINYTKIPKTYFSNNSFFRIQLESELILAKRLILIDYDILDNKKD